jgi:hypothetical protein
MSSEGHLRVSRVTRISDVSNWSNVKVFPLGNIRRYIAATSGEQKARLYWHSAIGLDWKLFQAALGKLSFMRASVRSPSGSGTDTGTQI